MQIRQFVLATVGSALLAATPAGAAERALKAGNTGLAINNSGRIDLVTSTPITYTNRSVANGRRIINLRVAQPVLCADFQPAPNAGVNPVGIQIVDPNGDTSGLMFGGISSYDYFTNGTAASLFKITSDAQLACCTMLPAANASCVQGSAGGLVVDTLFANGYETVASAIAGKGTNPENLAVSMTGPATVAPNANYNYTITVSNAGSVALSNVRVRDWFPKASGGFPAPLANGTWTCTASGAASCGTPNGSGNIALNAVSLPVGTNISIAVSRQMSAGASNGTQFSVSAAAFAEPTASESTLANNQAALNGTVQTTTYSVNPSSLSFNGFLGVPTATQNVSIIAPPGNVGIVSLDSCSFTGAAAADFQLSPAPTFPTGVSPGATLNLPVRMVASAIGTRNATLTCNTSNAPGLPSFSVTLTGTATSAAPTISDIGDQTTLEDVATGSIAFTASDSDSVLTTASLSCSSTNSNLIDNSRCAFTGSEPNFTLVLSPKPNANGNVTVTVTVSDGSTSATDTFSYTATAVNDAPDFTLAANATYGTAGLKVVGNFVTALTPGGGSDEASQTVSVANVTLQSGAGLFASGGEPTYDSQQNILSFQLNGSAGAAVVRVRVQDNGSNGGPNGDVNFREKDFTITVQASE
ncbi:MAG: hypothetical protein U1F26_02165 [Lysobacterales bacterium]